ncbi:efflux RND transporter periplasmic adaptor subunit [Marinobacterium aestuariivivens]|uniref:Efflux RND transporter periplasmic adaptor subunit n=1 Tax=Marinobacterium aestuariivivens TaxID=1698799 RepID=A0ABW1ZVR5_9GAMM
MNRQRLLFRLLKNAGGPAFILVLSGALAMLGGCSDSAATDAAGPRYHPAQSVLLQYQTGYSVPRTFVGKVQMRQNASVGFEQHGKVARILVNEGDKVAHGQLLAQQNIELLEVEGRQLQAQHEQVDAELALIRASLKRQHALQNRGYASDQTLDELQARQLGLQAKRRNVEAAIAANRLRIEKSALRAPFDAVVSERRVDEGEVVGAGAPVLTLLQQWAPEVRVGVPVELVDQIAAKVSRDLRVGDRQYRARLLTAGADVDPVTRTVQLRFELPRNTGLVNGQRAWLSLEQHYRTPGFWVPLTALTDAPRGLWNLYTLEPTGDGQLYALQSRNVQVLHATAERAYVSGTLQEGERVLTAGLQRLVPGQMVRLAADERLAGTTP